jgi:hypothetical protein
MQENGVFALDKKELPKRRKGNINFWSRKRDISWS